jgi:hypothetical protein
VFVEYANLLEDWRREVKRISTALQIDLEARDEAVIDEFLTEDLWHHRHRGQVTEPFGTDWMGAIYETVRAAARDEAWDQSEFDRVYQAYQDSERGFHTVFEDYQRYRKFNRLMPPAVVKLGLAVLAFAHRRSGTWV